jgi:hypothetical protein
MPEKIELKASSGYARLDQSALETIRNWKFVPARQGDQKITAWVIVPITFTWTRRRGARRTPRITHSVLSQHAGLPLVASQIFNGNPQEDL